MKRIIRTQHFAYDADEDTVFIRYPDRPAISMGALGDMMEIMRGSGRTIRELRQILVVASAIREVR